MMSASLPRIQIQACSPVESGEPVTPITFQRYFSINLSTAQRNQSRIESVDKLVFENQKEALDLLKQFRSARFKVFDNYDAALEFAQDYAIECEPAPDSNVVSQSTKTETDSQKSKPLEASFESVGKQFPSLKENLLTRFRRAIESGNMSFVVECVESNPKYLISSCETPVILFAGNRYNAVHCACKANQVDILRYVLDKISDEQYVNRMFEDRNPYTATARCVHLLDFYLNTPDKIAHDTPMHVAAKFGSVDCLQALLEYSLCDTKKENKDNKRIDQVLCERKGDEQIKQQMKDCLQNRYYINLVKKVDISGCMSDILSIEVSFGKLLDRDFVIGETNRSGKQAKICAVAGPMTEASAKELKEKFKSPMNRSLNEIQVNLSDPNTGYVRIARNYCKANSFSWKEYWHFLDQIIDLASDRGLELLENHLKSQLNNQKQNLSRNLIDCFERLKIVEDKREFYSQDSEDEVYYTPPTSPGFLTPLIEQEADNELDFALFINGDRVTSEDFDAATALVNVDLSPYPLTYRWWDRVLSLMSPQRLTSFTSLEGSINSSALFGDSSFLGDTPIKLKDLKSPIKSPLKSPHLY